MTGPEHYRKAESMLAAVAAEAEQLDAVAGDDGTIPAEVAGPMAMRWANTIAAAQVHATLALAAASVRMGRDGGTPNSRNWHAVVEVSAGPNVRYVP